MERRAARGVVVAPQPAAMCGHKGTTNCQTEPEALLLGGEEWVEQPVAGRWRDARTLVNDGDFDGAVAVGLGDNIQPTIIRRIVPHRIAGIADEVEQYLLQLHA